MDVSWPHPRLDLRRFLASCEGVVGEIPGPGETSADVSIEDVSLPVSCRIRPASNRAVTCVVSTGSETEQLESCETLQTFTLTRAVPGSVEVRASATAGLATAEKSTSMAPRWLSLASAERSACLQRLELEAHPLMAQVLVHRHLVGEIDG